MTRLILLPGMDGTGDCFAPFLEQLDSSIPRTIITYDTQHPCDYAELEMQVRNQLPKDELFVILGESFSGPIAIAIAAHPPANLIAAIFVCTFARSPLPLFKGMQTIISKLPLKLAPFFTIQYFILGKYSSKPLRNMLAQAISKVSNSVFRVRANAALNVDYSDLARQIQLPCLSIVASEDLLISKATSEHLALCIKEIEVEKIRAPHFVLQVAPQLAAQAVQKFLKKCSLNSKH
ncbi:alpha/beta fold hydrolase [Undibacterium danionis]|uniref:Alpha/beta fold hydrolase n=1 Tax=Undibacterium danionis TaxID=1812100 RepID=A0ABV6IEX9_9BURK